MTDVDRRVISWNSNADTIDLDQPESPDIRLTSVWIIDSVHPLIYEFIT